jgi:hypothetical protein
MNRQRKLVFLVIGIIIAVKTSAQEILVSEEYKDFLYNFEKLADDEILSYEFEYFTLDNKEYTFKVFADNVNTNAKRLIGYWRTPYAAYQFSYNRKSLVFFEYSRKRNCPLFLLDGNAGTVKYLMHMNTGAITTRDLKYLFYDSGSYDPSVHNFTLIDLEKMEIVRTVRWGVHPRWGGGTSVFRSIDRKYDFRMDYSVEKVLYATCYYNISTDELKVVLNDTTDENIEVLRRREPVLKEEIGFF